MNKLLWLTILFPLAGWAVDRISETEMDLSKPMLLHITPGRSTIIQFPWEVNHAVLGLEGDIKVKIGPDSKKSLIVWSLRKGAQSTNLTVKCKGRFFVFDIYPNSVNHQDIVRIKRSFEGGKKEVRNLVASSSQKKTPRVILERRLITDSTQKEGPIEKVKKAFQVQKGLKKYLKTVEFR